MKPKLIVIEGTNASGKSGLGVILAEMYGGEIVSADSRQVYRGLDLGSGKITVEEMRGIPHYLIDIVEPNDFFSMHDYQYLAYEAIDGIIDRGNLPFLVGGTGLYISSVTEGYVMSDREPDLEYRAYLETMQTPELYDMLVRLNPQVQVDAKNRNRVMRMLEKIHDGDDYSQPNAPRYDCLKLGVTWDRDILRERIDIRLDNRIRDGLVEEVAGLIEQGASIEFLKKLGLEYRYITQYLIGEIPDWQDMIDRLSLSIKQFAKRQMTWFRRDPEIIWLDMQADPVGQACGAIENFLDG